MAERTEASAGRRNWRASLRRRVPKSLLWRVAWARLAYAGTGPSGNFGDELSPLLIRELFNIRVKQSGMDAADLISTGSLLEWANSHVEGESPIVWGSGFIEAGPRYRGGGLDVRAVRGQLSLDRLDIPPDRHVPLGDPGLLASIAFPRSVLPVHDKIGIVPHLTDRDHHLVAQASMMPGVEVIDVQSPVETVIDKIAECGLVVSSSLHGLVVAESYGVPNVWCRLGDGVIGGDYKFRDYYSAFGMDAEPDDLMETLSRSDSLRREWKPLPGLGLMQRDLLNAFPVAHSKDRAVPRS